GFSAQQSDGTRGSDDPMDQHRTSDYSRAAVRRDDLNEGLAQTTDLTYYAYVSRLARKGDLHGQIRVPVRYESTRTFLRGVDVGLGRVCVKYHGRSGGIRENHRQGNRFFGRRSAEGQGYDRRCRERC